MRSPDEVLHAKQQERARLARDLHDSVTQAVFAATLKAEALSTAGECVDAQVAEAAREVRRLCQGALAELRTMLLELRGERFEDVPLGQLLRQLVEATEGRAGVDVTLIVRDGRPLPEAVHTTIYRIAQEALNNVARHARASHAWVTFESDESGARLEVRDDGRGFLLTDFGPAHIGLRSMQERALGLGADLLVESSPSSGTRIAFTWASVPAD